jgi:WD40 repeat protein
MGYQATALQTIHELPELAFKESLPALPVQDTQRAPVTRRQLLVSGTLAATALAGLGSGVWGISRDLSAATSMQLPTQPTVSARPSSTGSNKPVLVLTGHSRPVSTLLWSHDSSFLITAGEDSQVLRWDIAALYEPASLLHL